MGDAALDPGGEGVGAGAALADEVEDADGLDEAGGELGAPLGPEAEAAVASLGEVRLVVEGADDAGAITGAGAVRAGADGLANGDARAADGETPRDHLTKDASTGDDDMHEGLLRARGEIERGEME
ncbi:MAG: hypothetical protein R3F14_46740 [Polyangiaceae bacterium]